MFARPKKVTPTRKLTEVDRSFTKVVKPLISRSTISSPKVAVSSDDSLSGATEESSSVDTGRIHSAPVSPTRTGDYRSYFISEQNEKSRNFYVDKRGARRMYRVLVCKENAIGRKLLIDSLDGKIYCDGFTYKNRLAKDIVLFESKSAALSERYPHNQVIISYSSFIVTLDRWLFPPTVGWSWKRRKWNFASYPCCIRWVFFPSIV